MDEATKSAIMAMKDNSPTKAFFEYAKEGMNLSTEKELQRIAEVVYVQGALFYVQMWDIGVKKMEMLLEAEQPPLSLTWITTLEFLSINRKFRVEGAVVNGESSNDVKATKATAAPLFIKSGETASFLCAAAACSDMPCPRVQVRPLWCWASTW